jgi:predicted lipoprotein with Yx(FWY)xxD motif
MRDWSKLTRMAVAVVASAVALQAFADNHAVKVASKDKIGSYLTDAKGVTLYIFKKDSPGKSACAGECVAKWPLYYRAQVAATGTLKSADFGSITREDGQKQTTYKGLPLYYFAGDKAAGDTSGQGVRDVWYVAAP